MIPAKLTALRTSFTQPRSHKLDKNVEGMLSTGIDLVVPSVDCSQENLLMKGSNEFEWMEIHKKKNERV
jgi:hypothetical protein